MDTIAVFRLGSFTSIFFQAGFNLNSISPAYHHAHYEIDVCIIRKVSMKSFSVMKVGVYHINILVIIAITQSFMFLSTPAQIRLIQSARKTDAHFSVIPRRIKKSQSERLK